MAAEPWAFDDHDADLWAALAVAARPALSGLIRQARPAWHAEAACAGTGIDFFDAGQVDAARAVCAACPVTGPCRQVGEREGFGVWGGVSWRLSGRGCKVCGEDRPAYRAGTCCACYFQDMRARRKNKA